MSLNYFIVLGFRVSHLEDYLGNFRQTIKTVNGAILGVSSSDWAYLFYGFSPSPFKEFI